MVITSDDFAASDACPTKARQHQSFLRIVVSFSWILIHSGREKEPPGVEKRMAALRNQPN
jgi:hypothetical protein